MGQMPMSKVDLVLTLDKMCHDYRVELSPLEAEEWATRAEYYNAMNRWTMLRLVQAVNERIPCRNYGKDNPNNGLPLHSFLVGNEGSRVIYVRVHLLPLAYLHADVSMLKTDLVTLGLQAKADESAVVEENGVWFTVRYWWD